MVIITISGHHGAGKSTVAKLVAKKLGFAHYSGGDLMRKLSKEYGMPWLAFHKYAEKHPEIDKKIDEMQIQLGKEEDNFVIDSLIGYHFIPHSIKVYLDVDEKESARRIFKDKRDIESFKSMNAAIQEIRKRIASNAKRYKTYYGVKFPNPKACNLVIDTTRITSEQAAKKIIAFVQKNSKAYKARKNTKH